MPRYTGPPPEPSEMPESVAGVLALFITTASTVLLMWGTSRWGPGSRRDGDGTRQKRRSWRNEEES